MTLAGRETIVAKLRVSLKKFLRLPNSFSSEVLFQVFPLDFLKWADVEYKNCRIKWEARLNRGLVSVESLERFVIPRVRNLPIEFNKLLKCFVSWCGACQRPFSPEHLEEHGVQGVKMDVLFENLDGIRRSLCEMRGRKAMREEIMEAYSCHLKGILNEVESVLNKYARSF